MRRRDGGVSAALHLEVAAVLDDVVPRAARARQHRAGEIERAAMAAITNLVMGIAPGWGWCRYLLKCIRHL
jgi:hypothetical protein